MIIAVYNKDGEILKQCVVPDIKSAIANAGKDFYIEIDDCSISDHEHMIEKEKVVLKPKHKQGPDVRKMVRDKDKKRSEIFRMSEEEFKKMSPEEAILAIWKSGRI